nr:hypothetical protein [Acidobacteriota bacterium]
MNGASVRSAIEALQRWRAMLLAATGCCRYSVPVPNSSQEARRTVALAPISAPRPPQRAALVIGHPGHELRVHGWLERARPLVLV